MAFRRGDVVLIPFPQRREPSCVQLMSGWLVFMDTFSTLRFLFGVKGLQKGECMV